MHKIYITTLHVHLYFAFACFHLKKAIEDGLPLGLLTGIDMTGVHTRITANSG